MTQKLRNHTKNRMSKSALLGALLGLLTFVAGLSHHPAAPANAAPGDGITAYVSPPFVQGPPSSYGTPIETFNSWSTCASFPASAVGTFTGTCTSSDPSYIWGGATTATDTPTVSGTPTRFVIAPVGQDLTLTFTTPAKYFGFWWSAGSAGNTVKLYTSASSSTPAATFTTDTINSILGGSITPVQPLSLRLTAALTKRVTTLVGQLTTPPPHQLHTQPPIISHTHISISSQVDPLRLPKFNSQALVSSLTTLQFQRRLKHLPRTSSSSNQFSEKPLPICPTAEAIL